MRSTIHALMIAAAFAAAHTVSAYGANDATNLAPALKAEAEETAAAMRDLVVIGVESGVKAKVYIEFGGSLVHGTLETASAEGIEVQTPMAMVSLPWKRISAKRLYIISKPYIPEGDAFFRLQVGKFCAANRLADSAREELSAASAMDSGLSESAREVLNFVERQTVADSRKMASTSRPTGSTSDKGKPKRVAVRVAGETARVLTALGKRHFMLGLTCGPDGKWMKETQAQGCLWDMRYQYLSGGVNTAKTWKEWNSPPGQFVRGYVNGSDSMGMVPVFSWYQAVHSSPNAGGEIESNKATVENANTMRQYFSDVKLFMEVCAKFGKPVILHVEPDLWGFFLTAPIFRPNDPDGVRVMVKSTGMAELAECEDTMAGFGKAFVALRDRYAPNVLLGWHASLWGWPSHQKIADSVRKCGKWDIIFVDPSDRDSAWRIAHGYHAEGAWWKENDFVRFREWCGKLHTATGLPLIAWQIPVGNTIMAACNNTEGHYMDNRPQHWLEDYPRNTNIIAWAQQGFIGLLFGGGAGGCTWFGDGGDGVTNPTPVEGNKGEKSNYADDDGGYMRMRAAKYYRQPLLFELSKPKKESKR